MAKNRKTIREVLEMIENVHSHWLTTGIAIFLLYCSHHRLKKEKERKLVFLATFTLIFYHQIYWDIIIKYCIVEAPRHILQV